MTKLHIGGAALAAFLIASPALGADMRVKALPPPPPVYTWTGWYVGINGGGAWGHSDTDLFINDPAAFGVGNVPGVQAAGTNRINNSGGLAGGQFGFLIQNGIIVSGLDFSIDWFGTDSTVASTNVFAVSAPNTFTLTQHTKTNFLALALMRTGLAFDGWYIYGTGGLAVSDMQYTLTYIDTFNNFTSGTVGGTTPGLAGGGGIEWKWDHWSLRGEYLFIEFQRNSGLTSTLLTNGLPIFPVAFSVGAKMKENVARGALSYHF